jgi:hypothetical protein
MIGRGSDSTGILCTLGDPVAVKVNDGDIYRFDLVEVFGFELAYEITASGFSASIRSILSVCQSRGSVPRGSSL